MPNNDVWNYMLTVYVGLIQMLDYQLNIGQTSNDKLYDELLKQDKTLDEQTNIYLKNIVNQNNYIIEILRKTNEKCEGNDTNNGEPRFSL